MADAAGKKAQTNFLNIRNIAIFRVHGHRATTSPSNAAI